MQFLLALLATGWLASEAAAEAPLPSPLSSHNVSIVIPYRPGGGFDLAVRAFAPYFARHLGEDVNVLPKNVPGAGGRDRKSVV